MPVLINCRFYQMFKKFGWLVVSLASLMAVPSWAGVGARPLGMGGAFVALADDPSAIYWNPAGTVITPQTAFTYSSLLNQRSNYSFNDYFAFNWCRLGWQKSGDLSWTETFLKLGGLLMLHDFLKEFLGDRDAAQAENQEQPAEERIESPPKPKPPAPPPPPPDPYWGWHYYYWGPPYYHCPRHPRDRREPEEPPPQPEEPGAEFPANLDKRAYLEALGFSYQHNYHNLTSVGQQRTGDWYNLAIGYRWLDSPWAWGLNIRLDSERIVQDQTALYEASCLEMDLGLLWRATEQLAAGLLIQDFLNTRLAFAPDYQTSYATNLRLGASYQPASRTVLAAQVSNLLGTGNAGRQFHLGIEQGIFYWLVARAGLLNRDWSAGLGLDFWGFKLDYGYVSGVTPRHLLGVTWRF